MSDQISNREKGNSKAQKPNIGRPKDADKQPEEKREILHDDGTTVIEKCSRCGHNVKMRTYATKKRYRYCVCPHCQSRVCIVGDTMRVISPRK